MQILDLMLDLVGEYGLTMLFISHDLAMVRHLADRILVMHRGRIIEQGSGTDIFERPEQAYTRQLLQSIPGRALLAQGAPDIPQLAQAAIGRAEATIDSSSGV